MHVFPGLTLSRSALGYSRLGPDFLTELAPEPVPEPHWVAHSEACAALLGLSADWHSPGTLDLLSGNGQPPGWASVYSGHQFGVWAGQLGDGRALHIGEIEHAGQRYELQLKGAGRTPYSRMGDGRAVLRSSIREFLCSEAMAALGIPTTRALCITGSGLRVRREEIETSAIVTRVTASFLRFGHFEHFAHHGLLPQLQQLFEHVLAQHAPECREAAVPAAALLGKISRQTAALMADWQAVGFMHGVMNTDNMSLLGLTLDYGPFGFMDGFDPGHVCNHSDHQGRYAYARQPNVAFWNLHALAQALLPLVPGDPEQASEPLLAALEIYRESFPIEMLGRLRAKLGLVATLPQDKELADDWLKLLAAHHTDYTMAWRRLGGFDSSANANNADLRDLFVDREAFDAWSQRYRERLRAEASIDAERRQRMNATNPAVVLRNHLAESAIRQAREGDFSEVERLLKVLQSPYDEPALASDAGLPPDWAAHLEVSCSS